MANISAQLLGIHNIFIQRLINLSNFYFVTKPSGSDIAQTCSLLSIISPLLLYFGVRLKSKQFLMQWVTIHNKLEYIFLQLQNTHICHTHLIHCVSFCPLGNIAFVISLSLEEKIKYISITI